MEAKRVVGLYIRVSTSDQHPEMQEQELVEYVKRHNWTLHRIYRDDGVTGAREDRPGLNALRSDVKRGRVNLVAVWSLDRMARSVRQLVELAEEFNSHSVDFVSLKQSIDTVSPAGRLTYHVLSAVAEFERELLRERVRSGLVQARRKGKRLGRPALRRFDADEIDEIRELRSRGASVRSLAIRFGTTQYIVSKLSERRQDAHAPKN
jgi:DNA invertase Pin-like site-specific DNA recombinase